MAPLFVTHNKAEHRKLRWIPISLISRGLFTISYVGSR